MVPLCRRLPGYISNWVDLFGFSPVFVKFYQTSSKPRPQVECHKFLQHVGGRINIKFTLWVGTQFPCSHWTNYCICKYTYVTSAAQTASFSNFIIRQQDILTAQMHFTTIHTHFEGGCRLVNGSLWGGSVGRGGGSVIVLYIEYLVSRWPVLCTCAHAHTHTHTGRGSFMVFLQTL
jgi:hypothetical protein